MQSIYGECILCEYMVVIRRDGMVRKHFKDKPDEYHQRGIRRALGMDPLPPAPQIPPARGDPVEIVYDDTPDDPGWEGREDIYEPPEKEPTVETETTRKLEMNTKRLRINVVIEIRRST